MDSQDTEAYEDAPAPQGEQPWSVQTLQDADWALERLADLERQIRENNELADAAIQRIRLRNSALNEKVQRGIGFFRAHLDAFAKTHRELLLGSGRKKTRELPHGSIAFRKSGGRLEVKASEDCLLWAQAQPVENGVLRIREELDKRGLNEWHARTGEVPPGCEVTPETEVVVIEAVESENSNGN